MRLMTATHCICGSVTKHVITVSNDIDKPGLDIFKCTNCNIITSFPHSKYLICA